MARRSRCAAATTRRPTRSGRLVQVLRTDEGPCRWLPALAEVRYPLAGPGHHALAGAIVPDAVAGSDPRVAAALRAARPVLVALVVGPSCGRGRRDGGGASRS